MVHAYLDYNASAPLLPEAADAMRAAMDTFGNPSSVHQPGRAARSLVEDAREAVARAVGATAGQVVFTSGGTEANNTALASTATVLAAGIEHPSVLSRVTTQIAVEPTGAISPDAVRKAIETLKPPFLVSVMLVNNETGVIQPVREIAAIVKERGGLLHCDAVQALGRVPFSLKDLGVDAFSLSAHKIGGPKGIGALVLDASVAPLIRGGGQERGRRAGTENVLGIVGFGAAASTVARQLADQSRLAKLRDDFETWARQTVQTAVIHGAGAARAANTACISVRGVSSEMQLIALDLAGVAVSAGAACSSGKVAESHVLRAMGVPSEQARCAIRISLGHATKADDLDKLRAAWVPVVAERAA